MLFVSVKCKCDNKSDGAENKNKGISKKGQNKKKNKEGRYRNCKWHGLSFGMRRI